MGTFRSLMIIFGMLFCVLVLTFAIGMCFPGFRQGLNNTFHVVPANNYYMTLEQLEQQSITLESLQTEKASLEEELAELQQSFDVDETEIATLEAEIAILNDDIVALQDNLLRISNNISGATLTYKGEEVFILTPIYDNNNNYLRTDGLSNSCGSASYWSGQDFYNVWNGYMMDILNAFQQNVINNPYDLQMRVNDFYYLNIGGDIMQFCCFNNEYYFAGDSTISFEYFVNDNAVNIEDVSALINVNRDYTTKVFIDYSLNAMNKVSSVDMSFYLQVI